MVSAVYPNCSVTISAIPPTIETEETDDLASSTLETKGENIPDELVKKCFDKFRLMTKKMIANFSQQLIFEGQVRSFCPKNMHEIFRALNHLSNAWGALRALEMIHKSHFSSPNNDRLELREHRAEMQEKLWECTKAELTLQEVCRRFQITVKYQLL